MKEVGRVVLYFLGHTPSWGSIPSNADVSVGRGRNVSGEP